MPFYGASGPPGHPLLACQPDRKRGLRAGFRRAFSDGSISRKRPRECYLGCRSGADCDREARKLGENLIETRKKVEGNSLKIAPKNTMKSGEIPKKLPHKEKQNQNSVSYVALCIRCEGKEVWRATEPSQRKNRLPGQGRQAQARPSLHARRLDGHMARRGVVDCKLGAEPMPSIKIYLFDLLRRSRVQQPIGGWLWCRRDLRAARFQRRSHSLPLPRSHDRSSRCHR